MADFYANLLSTYGPFAVFLLLMLTGIGIPLGEANAILRGWANLNGRQNQK